MLTLIIQLFSTLAGSKILRSVKELSDFWSLCRWRHQSRNVKYKMLKNHWICELGLVFFTFQFYFFFSRTSLRTLFLFSRRHKHKSWSRYEENGLKCSILDRESNSLSKPIRPPNFHSSLLLAIRKYISCFGLNISANHLLDWFHLINSFSFFHILSSEIFFSLRQHNQWTISHRFFVF